jgi:hypothetical protein
MCGYPKMDRLDQTGIWGPIADSIDEVRSFEIAAASASEVCGVAFADRNHPPALTAAGLELEAPLLAEHGMSSWLGTDPAGLAGLAMAQAWAGTTVSLVPYFDGERSPALIGRLTTLGDSSTKR